VNLLRSSVSLNCSGIGKCSPMIAIQHFCWSDLLTKIFLSYLSNSFDNIAKRRRVFKVETVGDCYVAVAGLPKPREDHAAVMARFATGRCLSEIIHLQAHY